MYICIYIYTQFIGKSNWCRTYVMYKTWQYVLCQNSAQLASQGKTV